MASSLSYRPRCPEQGALHQIVREHSALNLNVHFHALVLDGVFARDAHGVPRFYASSTRPALDLTSLLVTLATRLQRLLTRRGVVDGGDALDGWDPFADDAPTLAGLAAASVRGVAALGPRAGRPARRWGDDGLERRPNDAPRPWHARVHSFDLHAAVAVPAGARDRLECMCRYALRPAVGQERLRVSPEGQVVLDLRRPWADGTTHLVFDPVEFLERLAALVPRPRINLVLYYGVLAPRAAWRAAVVPSPAVDGDGEPSACSHGRVGRRPNRSWAELMERSFGFDVLACPRCAGRMTLVALIRDLAVVGRILRHLGLPDAVPTPRAGRAPPLPWEADAVPEGVDVA